MPASTAARYVVGIDTGGTYTDAVIIEATSQRLIAKAKALTTKGDLSVGVAEALAAALHGARDSVRAADICQVSLSTTLATNAIVEGHGAPVGVVLIGFDAGMVARSGIAAAMPAARLIALAGGHDHGGEEAAVFDAAGLVQFLQSHGSGLEAYAIAAHYSVRNRAHEQAARDIVVDCTGRPVSLSSDLAQALDAPRRALTAALNARIIGRIAALVAAVRSAMQRLCLDAPLMIVKGDGSLAFADAVALRPVETILSGPAASVVGARFLSGLDDFIVADIGGTTTDIAVVEGGQPRLNREGATAGGFRTMVRAIEMRSFALGGDSEVEVSAQAIVTLGPRRIVPLALLAARHPHIVAQLRASLLQADAPLYPGRYALLPFASAQRPLHALPETERWLLQRLGAGPVALGDLVQKPSALRAIDRLVKAGALQLAGFTPSDAAHVLERQGQWSRPAAVLGGALLLRWRLMRGADEHNETPVRALARQVFEAMTQAGARVLLGALAGADVTGNVFVEAAATGHGLGALRVSLQPKLPLVGVGGPAPVFYPALAERLGCALLLPPDGDAANAIGAAVGLVRARVVVEITTGSNGQWRVHDGGTPQDFDSPVAALAQAQARATALATAQQAALGGTAAGDLRITIERTDIPGMPGDQGLVGALVVAESSGAAAARLPGTAQETVP